MALGGLATPAFAERQRLVVPSEIGTVYSEAELQARLAFIPPSICPPEDCDSAEAFRERVGQLGQRLLPGAIQLAEEQGIDIPLITVTAPGKDDIGTASSAAGNIIVFDGVRALALPDAALAFVIAREMGHVIAKHHEENTATGLAVSLAVSVLFPVVGLMQGVEMAYAATTIASTATSFAGARIVRSLYEEDHRYEADGYALLILARTGWTPEAVADALREAAGRLDGDGWLADLRTSQHWLDGIVMGPHLDAAMPPAPQPAAELSPAHFGPRHDAETLWMVGLNQGVAGIERLCAGRQETRTPLLKPNTRSVAVKAKGKSTRKADPTRKAGVSKKTAKKRVAKPRPRTRLTASPSR